MTENNITQSQEVFVKMVLDAWNSKVSQLDKLQSEFSDEQLLKEVAPGRNRGIYLLGHLTALGDSIFPLLGHEKTVPHFFKPFVETPDTKKDDLPPVSEVRQAWARVKSALAEKMAAISSDEWFQRHTAISEEDFAKEPHRNKLNVILGRVTHLDYHLGQLVFLKAK